MLNSAIKSRASLPDYDAPLVWVLLLMLSFGLVMVYSASIDIAAVNRSTGHNYAYYLIRHAIYLAIGLAGAFAAFQVPTRLWQRGAPYLFLGGIVLLIGVLIPGIGREVNGSYRWISLHIVNVQPSELMKLFVVLYAADYTVRKAAYMHSFRKGFLPMLLVMLLIGGLLLREPDFGAFVVIAAISMAILFLGGLSWRQFGLLIVLLVIGFLLLIWSSPYRMQRVMGFMDPWADPYGKGYQLSHALIAFGRGEWFGVGLGGSVEKLLYLPEAYTDFLLAVIAEELGLAGVVVVVLAFAWLTWRIFRIGRQAAAQTRYFPALVAQGTGVWLAVQAVINIGVNMGLLPTKGLTLPLLSYGGSGIVSNCVALGILLRVDWENRQLLKGYSV